MRTFINKIKGLRYALRRSRPVREFFKAYWLLHTTGTVLRLAEWHDSFVLDQLRVQLNVPAVNLAEAYADQLKGPANVFDVVFPMAHHKKGNLKHQTAAA